MPAGETVFVAVRAVVPNASRVVMLVVWIVATSVVPNASRLVILGAGIRTAVERAAVPNASRLMIPPGEEVAWVVEELDPKAYKY